MENLNVSKQMPYIKGSVKADKMKQHVTYAVYFVKIRRMVEDFFLKKDWIKEQHVMLI